MPGRRRAAPGQSADYPHASCGAAESVAWSIVAAAAVAAGFGLRVWIFTSPLSSLESDEAVVGLMAIRALHGEFPVFYWGGLYGGSQEALVAAAAFAVSGPGTLVLKLNRR